MLTWQGARFACSTERFAAGVFVQVEPSNPNADDPENHHKMGHEGRHKKARQSALLQAQRGNAHAGERRRHTGDSEFTRSRIDNDGDLHARRNAEG